MKRHITGCTAKYRQVSFLGPSHSDTVFLERPRGLMVVLGTSPRNDGALHALSTGCALSSHFCCPQVLWAVRQREPSQPAVKGGVDRTLILTPHSWRSSGLQLLSELDGLGLCLQICYRGKPLKFWTPLFLAHSPVLYESRDPVELNMDWLLAELLCKEMACRQALQSGIRGDCTSKPDCCRNIQGWGQWGLQSPSPGKKVCCISMSSAQAERVALVAFSRNLFFVGWKTGFSKGASE